jgi:hypothetical protein
VTAAIVQICSDPRLNHEAIRHQVRDKIERLGLSAGRIFVLNDIGGNVGENTRNAIDLLNRHNEPIVFGAVLYHDDCMAAQEGVRRPLTTSLSQMTNLFNARNVQAPIYSGFIYTDSSALIWHDDPPAPQETFSFRMPRMYG